MLSRAFSLSRARWKRIARVFSHGRAAAVRATPSHRFVIRVSTPRNPDCFVSICVVKNFAKRGISLGEAGLRFTGAMIKSWGRVWRFRFGPTHKVCDPKLQPHFNQTNSWPFSCANANEHLKWSFSLNKLRIN